ncbi:MAG: rod shape-determining protein RodA [Candidatus Omnitrophica bacterium CG11_big_fil_rev_8_21_14_0_20_42_13]|uniref:Peptidoglycan glycosyltransferase RodA n=1 Tax=Candidatus Ghiorseimicrobium undicola TaxID=1974746 RepID=A0A2H0LX77_9BACT|nr:MAG: rod shape-determining protein RodA [Candidatus Omnitrophica bacterium CG11_big_fil_rev_8_21_14_0_20_42_13]
MDRNARRLFIIALVIAIIGLLTIYSTSHKDGAIFFRQFLWLFFGIGAFFIFYNFNYRKFYDLAFGFYLLSIVFLVLVLVSGRVKLGAQRWLELGVFNFQPSELAKFSVILCLARYFSQKDAYNVKLRIRDTGFFRTVFIPALLVAFPALLIMQQPDLGTAIIFIFVFIALIFVAGVKKRYVFSLLALNLISLPVAWHFLKDYQKERLLVFINPNLDPLGAGYTVIQSKIAVGSGRLFGLGWLSGTQNTLNFLPERHTDFIFSCFAESMGLIGSFILLAIFYMLFNECIKIIYSTKDPFGRLLIIGIMSVIFFQVVVNICMTIGVMPVVGIPLPLVSYGGTSMFMTFMGLGIIGNISKRRMVF